MDNYRAKEVLEYTKTLDNIQGTASSIAIDIGIIALDKIENASQKLESLIDNMEIYTVGRPNTEKVQVSVLQMQRFINEIKDIKNHLDWYLMKLNRNKKYSGRTPTQITKESPTTGVTRSNKNKAHE